MGYHLLTNKPRSLSEALSFSRTGKRRTPVVGTRREHLYSVSAVTNSSGNVVERYTYDAYGKMYVRNADGSLKGSQVPMQPYGFTGRRYDSESGIWYFRARYFDDQLGRFISRDPLGYVDGMSLYSGYFVPGGVDPWGFCHECDEHEQKRHDEILQRLLASGMSAEDAEVLARNGSRDPRYRRRKHNLWDISLQINSAQPDGNYRQSETVIRAYAPMGNDHSLLDCCDNIYWTQWVRTAYNTSSGEYHLIEWHRDGDVKYEFQTAEAVRGEMIFALTDSPGFDIIANDATHFDQRFKTSLVCEKNGESHAIITINWGHVWHNDKDIQENWIRWVDLPYVSDSQGILNSNAGQHLNAWDINNPSGPVLIMPVQVVSADQIYWGIMQNITSRAGAGIARQ